MAAEDADCAEEALPLHRMITWSYTVLDRLQRCNPMPLPCTQTSSATAAARSARGNLANVVDHNFWQKGDVEEGFAAADYVFENTFRTRYISIKRISSPHASVVYRRRRQQLTK